MTEIYLTLNESEAAILSAASTIMAAYITSNQVTPENEKQMVNKSILMAIGIAEKTASVIVTRGEVAGDASKMENEMREPNTLR